MADENLKKINDELENEKLNDEELDKVAGGTYYECLEISKLIGPVVQKRICWYDNFSLMSVCLETSQLPDYLKKTYNIDAELDEGYPSGEEGAANIYKINGKQITHKEVLDIIKASQK